MSIVLIAIGLSSVTPSSTPAELENLAWRLMNPYREEKFQANFAPDFTGLYADGRHDLRQEMRNVRAMKLSSYKLGSMRSQAIDPDSVLLTYSVDLRGVVWNKPVSGRRWVASLWHRRHGKWLNVYHTEIKAQ
jgi:hypothetical protein